MFKFKYFVLVTLLFKIHTRVNQFGSSKIRTELIKESMFSEKCKLNFFIRLRSCTIRYLFWVKTIIPNKNPNLKKPRLIFIEDYEIFVFRRYNTSIWVIYFRTLPYLDTIATKQSRWKISKNNWFLWWFLSFLFWSSSFLKHLFMNFC